VQGPRPLSISGKSSLGSTSSCSKRVSWWGKRLDLVQRRLNSFCTLTKNLLSHWETQKGTSQSLGSHLDLTLSLEHCSLSRSAKVPLSSSLAKYTGSLKPWLKRAVVFWIQPVVEVGLTMNFEPSPRRDLAAYGADWFGVSRWWKAMLDGMLGMETLKLGDFWHI
jgi:hypothetical protein